MSQPNYYELFSASKTYTYAAIASANAILASGAPTATTPQTFSGAALNGSADSGARSAAGLPFEQAITVTTTAHTGSYKITAAIIINGVAEDGTLINDQIFLVSVNGGDAALSTNKGFVKVTSIVVPAMNDALGAFTFGIGDIVLARPVRTIRSTNGGSVKVGYPGNINDTLDLIAGDREPVLPIRIYDAGNTASPLRLYA
jgi:hypothetical protein